MNSSYISALKPYAVGGIWLVVLPYLSIVFSSPMPISYGWPEALMGAGLVLGWGWSFLRLLSRELWRDKRNFLAIALLLYLFVVPLAIGFRNGNAIGDIIRDVVPFLFLTLPALYAASRQCGEKPAGLLLYALLFVGVVSASQFFWVVLDRMGSSSKWVSNMEGAIRGVPTAQLPDFWNVDIKMRNSIVKLYDPAALFSAVYLLCFGFRELFSSVGRRLLGCLSIFVAAFCTYCFMMIGLRAHSALIFLSFLVFSAVLSREDRRYRTSMCVVLPLAAIATYPLLKDAIHLMIVKQVSVGTNGKLEEWLSVIQTLASSKAYLFGIGWGGLVDNPVTVYKSRFTHSILSFYLLKTGLFGLGAMSVAFGLVLAKGSLKWGKDRADQLLILLSALPPILVGVLFQPSYKMLSFALVLSVLFLSFHARRFEGTEV